MSARSAAAGADFLVVNRPHPAGFYGPKPSGSIHLPESILRDLASRHSFAFEDLGRSFGLDWKSRGERFDFEYDSHWNEHGHQVAAEALAAILTPMLARSSGRRALEGASP